MIAVNELANRTKQTSDSYFYSLIYQIVYVAFMFDISD